VEAFKAGWVEDEINRSRTERLRKLNSGESILVGVNRYREESEGAIEIFYPDEGAWEKERSEYLAEYRKKRNQEAVSRCLDAVKATIQTDANMIPSITEAVEAGATMGEIHDAMREAIGFTIE
jgi:methylmalonyl-CoA mutase N-terminal domain/subunit